MTESPINKANIKDSINRCTEKPAQKSGRKNVVPKNFIINLMVVEHYGAIFINSVMGFRYTNISAEY